MVSGGAWASDVNAGPVYNILGKAFKPSGPQVLYFLIRKANHFSNPTLSDPHDSLNEVGNTGRMGPILQIKKQFTKGAYHYYS